MECGLGALLLLVLYIIWDVNYFIRVVFTVGLGRLFQKKRQVLDTTSIYGMLLCSYLAIYIYIHVVLFYFVIRRPLHHPRCGHLFAAHEQRPVSARTGLCPIPLLLPHRHLRGGEAQRRRRRAGRVQRAVSPNDTDL